MNRSLTLSEVKQLRGQIVLNSLYVSDYRNSLGVDSNEACSFFDGYVDYLQELATEDGFDVTQWNLGNFFEKYDNEVNLENWLGYLGECPLCEEIEEDIEYE